MESSNKTESQIESRRIYNLIEALQEKPVLLLAEKSEYTHDELEEYRNEKGLDILYACDFLIAGIEKYEKDGYFEWGNIINLDHHSDATSLMGKQITSTTMVIDYLKKHPGLVVPPSSVSTHHSDCDSTSATLILNGIIPPELYPMFAEASIAADYTGKANTLGDLMQAMKHGPSGVAGQNASAKFNAEKYNFLVRNLQAFLNEGIDAIEPEARVLYDRHLGQRAELRQMKEAGEYESVGENEEVVYIETDPNAKFDATMLVDIHPTAKVIFTYFKQSTKNEKTGEITEGYVINARAGQDVPVGFDIRKVMKEIGEPFGGRWGGGANKRKTDGRGTPTPPGEVARKIYEVIKN